MTNKICELCGDPAPQQYGPRTLQLERGEVLGQGVTPTPLPITMVGYNTYSTHIECIIEPENLNRHNQEKLVLVLAKDLLNEKRKQKEDGTKHS